MRKPTQLRALEADLADSVVGSTSVRLYPPGRGGNDGPDAVLSIVAYDTDGRVLARRRVPVPGATPGDVELWASEIGDVGLAPRRRRARKT